MCGISGIVTRRAGQGKQLGQRLEDVQQRIKHRGPDDEGYLAVDQLGNCTPLFGQDTAEESKQRPWLYAPKQDLHSISSETTVLLGHRRLSILDLSARGHQPMCHESGFWITYNGELYNYVELREQLKNKGHQFSTGTDTEVVLAAYREWGQQCLDHFNGMWAFVIYDPNKQVLFGARDRTGVKPLYYRLTDEDFTFCSEIKGLVGDQKNQANLSVVYSILVYNQFHWQEQTPFEQITELPPAHRFSYSLKDHTLGIEKYYEPSFNPDRLNALTSADWQRESEQLELLLERSVHQHLRSDVAVGSCLSGGLDSSTLVALAAQKNTDFYAFSACFPGQAVDEEEYIRQQVERYQLNWRVTYPSAQKLIEHLEDLVYTQDLPLLSTSTFAQYQVMAKAQEQGIKVLLNGQGADELLGGYDRYFETASWHFLKQLDVKQANAYSKSGLGIGGLRNLLKPGVTNFKMAQIRNKLLDSTLPEPGVISESLKAHGRASGDSWYESVNEHLFHDYYKGFLSTLLRAEDRNSMRFSIESRVPFADDLHLAEWAFSLPSAYKLQPNENKPLLRRFLERRKYLPQSLLDRTDKLGFATPNNNWLKEEKDKLIAYLEYIPKEWVNQEELVHYWSSNVDNPGPGSENYRLFKWISLGIWCKKFNIS